MIVLAFDLGTKTGVAAQWPHGGIGEAEPIITYTTWKLVPVRRKGEKTDPNDYGGRFNTFRASLDLTARAGRIGHVFYEEVHAHNGVRAAHIYGGLKAVLTAWCEAHGIPYSGVGVGTIKKRATGKGNASKEQVRDAMRAKGFEPKTFDESDALALLLGVLEIEAAKVSG